MGESQKIAFADALRGLAAVMVLILHYGVLFWLDQPVVASLTGLPAVPEHVPVPPGVSLLRTPVIDLGVLAVGTFFLISGFVIPFSLRRYDRAGFLAGRIVRILPTYGVGFAIGVLILWLGGLYFGVPFPHSTRDVLAHSAPGLRAWMQAPFIDGIIWTLEIEVMFYLVCALAAGSIAKGRLRTFLIPLAIFAVCFLAYLWAAYPAPQAVRRIVKPLMGPVTSLSWTGPYIIFVFIGVAAHFRHRGTIGWYGFAALSAGLFGLFTLAHWSFGLAPSWTIVYSYAAALALFLIAWRLPAHWFTLRPLRFFAAISYPMYVIHPILGYVLMRLLVEASVPSLPATILAWAVAIGGGYALHRAVEKPSQDWAQQIAQGRFAPWRLGLRGAQPQQT